MLRKLVEYLLQNPNRFKTALLPYRQRLSELYFQYPSVINSGFLHMDRIITLMKQENLGQSQQSALVDIGAARGEMLEILQKTFPECQKYAFEPRKEDFTNLESKFGKKSSFTLVNKALGATSVAAMEMNNTARSTSSSLLKVNTQLSDTYFAENIKTVATENIELSTLDEEIPNHLAVDLLKIDVQGYELEVLRGGTNTLKRTAMILVEMQNHQIYEDAAQYYEIDEFLRQQSFGLFEIIPSIRRRGKLYEWDAIYVNNKINQRYQS